MFLLEGGSIAYAAIQAWLLPINLVGVIVAVGSGIVAWSQIRRYSDLSTSYAIASDDLTLIAERFNTISDQQALDAFVKDTEKAVSREHSNLRGGPTDRIHKRFTRLPGLEWTRASEQVIRQKAVDRLRDVALVRSSSIKN